MKRFKRPVLTVLLLLMIAALLLPGCGQKADKRTFSATVMRVDDGGILVRPAQEASEYKNADLISVGLSDTEITDAKGIALTLADLSVGLRVDITYGGVILESYPAQITDCTKLTAHVGAAQLPNPMIGFETPDFRFVAGFALEGMPATVGTDGVWLIGGKIAQLDISTADGAEGMLRCAKGTGEDISGLYGISFEEQSAKLVGDMAVELAYTQDSKALARWQRDGYDFVLWFPEISTDAFMTAVESVVGGVKAVAD